MIPTTSGVLLSQSSVTLLHPFLVLAVIAFGAGAFLYGDDSLIGAVSVLAGGAWGYSMFKTSPVVFVGGLLLPVVLFCSAMVVEYEFWRVVKWMDESGRSVHGVLGEQVSSGLDWFEGRVANLGKELYE